MPYIEDIRLMAAEKVSGEQDGLRARLGVWGKSESEVLLDMGKKT